MPPLQLIQKFYGEDSNKTSKSQQLIDSKEVFLTTFTFWFHLFRSADKIDEDDAFVHLILPPPALPRDGKGDFNPWPFYIY